MIDWGHITSICPCSMSADLLYCLSQMSPNAPHHIQVEGRRNDSGVASPSGRGQERHLRVHGHSKLVKEFTDLCVVQELNAHNGESHALRRAKFRIRSCHGDASSKYLHQPHSLFSACTKAPCLTPCLLMAVEASEHRVQICGQVTVMRECFRLVLHSSSGVKATWEIHYLLGLLGALNTLTDDDMRRGRVDNEVQQEWQVSGERGSGCSSEGVGGVLE